MIIIANPIYDVVFKYLMEDNRVAKILLSALLQKEVVELEVRPHEYSKKVKREISTFRIDFSAKIREKDGSEHLVLIELQKTWRATETMRFRQYLGAQYLDERNLLPKERNPRGYGLPIISIYLLDHRVGDLQEPVVYVRRRYLDYDSHPVLQGVPDPFVESLTHDAIIVQIPLLKGRARNHLERLLEVFDQNHRVEGDSHYLCIDEDKPRTPDEELVIDRLLRAAATPDVLREMRIEDEFLSELERLDTALMLKDQTIEQKDQVIGQKDQVIEQQEQELEQKDQVIEQKDQELEANKQELEASKQALEQKNKMLVALLHAQGAMPKAIADQLQLTEEEDARLLK